MAIKIPRSMTRTLGKHEFLRSISVFGEGMRMRGRSARRPGSPKYRQLG